MISRIYLRIGFQVFVFFCLCSSGFSILDICVFFVQCLFIVFVVDIRTPDAGFRTPDSGLQILDSGPGTLDPGFRTPGSTVETLDAGLWTPES